MLTSDIVRVLESGFQIDPKVVQPLGITDNSICWAVRVPDPREHNEGENRWATRSPHILISSIHPESWPFLLRFEIRLRHAPGMIHRVSSIVAKNGFNIHFGESAATGHHHATWNVVVEASNVRHAFGDKLSRHYLAKKRTVVNASLRKLTNRLAERMYAAAVDFRRKLIDLHNSEVPPSKVVEDVGFLHNRIVQHYQLLHNPSEFAKQDTRDAAERDLPEAVGFHWMQNLAFFAVYGEVLRPVQFQYFADRGLLKPASTRDFSDLLEDTDFSPSPTRAAASIDSAEHYIRLVPISQTRVKERLICVDLNYDLVFRDLGPNCQTSRGLWRDVSRTVQGKDINIIRMANAVSYRDANSEAGCISLVGESAHRADDALLSSIRTEVEKIQPVNPKNFKSTAIVRRFPDQEVFISMRNEMHDADWYRNTITECARENGLQPIIVRDPHGKSLTQEVDSRLMGCHAFFQLIGFSESEYKEKKDPNLTWLFHEFGVATGRSLPRVRLVETSAWNIDDWKRYLKTSGDEFLASFSQLDGRPKIREKITIVIQSLIKDLSDAQRSVV